MMEKNTISKLLKDVLSSEEKVDLLHNSLVEDYMRLQWDNISEKEGTSLVEKRIWKKIQLRMDVRKINRQILFYKIVAIASLLLILSMGTVIYQMKQHSEYYTHIFSSGIRSIESVILPDGTKVQLGSNSRLTYPSYFEGRTREVKLTGQAFFEVMTDEEKPFIVHTESMDITALGTAFEVFSYSQKEEVETILKEGKIKVELHSRLLGEMKDIILEPNEMLVFNKQDGEYKVKNVNATNYSAWSDEGILSFENERLNMILARLEPWYGRKIECSPEIAEKYRFTFKVRDESLERILFMMKNSSPIKYEEKNEGYIIYIDE